MSFSEGIRNAADANRTRIVLALDLEGGEREQLSVRSENLLRKVSSHICAVKVNRQLVMSLGLERVETIVRLAHERSLPAIMDAKLNDVGHTNEFMARSYFDAGFDAIIASPIAGWEDGLDRVFAQAASRSRSIILLTYMSNPGAEAFYSLSCRRADEEPRPVFELLSLKAIEWRADGVVVGATRPDVIARVRELVGSDLAIYSPGVGAQGGDARRALKAGATYLIVGRSIYNATDPERAAMELQASIS